MPRRQRSKVNKRPEIGTLNCSWGMFSKANALFRQYDVDVVVIARRPDGGIGGYQSRPGLARDFLQINEQDLLGPHEVDPYMSKPSKGVAVLRAMSSSRSSSCLDSTENRSSRSSSSCVDSIGSETSPGIMEEAEPGVALLNIVRTPHCEEGEGFMEEPLHPWAEVHSIPNAQRCASPETICPIRITKPAKQCSRKTKEDIRQPTPLSRIKREEILALIKKFE
ncbi:hypothetical protein VCV18_004846 [Metarhizium anisopliae]